MSLPNRPSKWLGLVDTPASMSNKTRSSCRMYHKRHCTMCKQGFLPSISLRGRECMIVRSAGSQQGKWCSCHHYYKKGIKGNRQHFSLHFERRLFLAVQLRIFRFWAGILDCSSCRVLMTHRIDRIRHTIGTILSPTNKIRASRGYSLVLRAQILLCKQCSFP